MTTDGMKVRTKKFSLMVINLAEKLPNFGSSEIIASQIIKSGTSVGADYRAVCRSKSDEEFASKIEIVLEKADETLFWIEIIAEKKWIGISELETIWKEGNELTAILVNSLKAVNNRISVMS